MKEEFKDFYKILEISPNSTSECIKKAFQRLAKKFHPDSPESLDTSGDRFKEISEAYEVLIDPEKRAKYDLERNNYYESNYLSNHEINNILRKYRSFNTDIYEFLPANKITSKFKYSFKKASIKVPLSFAYEGGELHATGLPGGVYVIKVPPASPNGSIALIETPEGYYQIQLVVEEEPPFKLKGNDIEVTVFINLVESILGCRKSIIDPAGKSLDLFIPECTPHGVTIKFPNKGLGDGDLLVNIEVLYPEKLSEKAKEYIISFAKEIGLQIPSK